MSTREEKKTAGAVAGYAGPAHPAHATIRPAARAGHRAGHSANIGKCAAGRTRRALSRATAPGGGGMDCGALGHFGKQPQSSLLYSDPGRAKTACQREHAVEAARNGHWTDSRAGGEGGLGPCSDESGRRATSVPKLTRIYSLRPSA